MMHKEEDKSIDTTQDSSVRKAPNGQTAKDRKGYRLWWRHFANTKQQQVLCSPFSGTFSLIPTCLASTVSSTASLETGGVTDTYSESDNT